MPRIIIIEDEEWLSKSYAETIIEAGYEAVPLLTYRDVIKFTDGISLEDHPHDDISAIIFDYKLDKKRPNRTSIPFIKQMKDEGFKGIMLANSSLEECLALQMEAGCTHQRDPGIPKDGAADFLLTLLP